MEKLESWLSTIPSKNTRKSYQNGIKRFEVYYKKPIEKLISLNDVESGHEIERYFAWLKDNGVPQNSRRNIVLASLDSLLNSKRIFARGLILYTSLLLKGKK
jgi:site-specific recombinase XerD